MAIIYSKNSELNNSMIGKLETPLKMIIEHESDAQAKLNSVQKSLFNIEKSKKFGETIVGTSDFDVFSYAAEGAGAENDSIQETYKKFIEHIQFMKEFTITAEMMEDANYGVGTDAKRRAEQFTRSYYRTMNKICSTALINGTNTSAVFAKANLNLTTIDGYSLFHRAHKLSAPRGNEKTQSNYFTAKGWSTSGDGIESMLAAAGNKIRNMKDENGYETGYTANTIILPGDKPMFEMAIKKACGSENVSGSNLNAINVHYGNWNVVVLDDWHPGDNRFMIMSTEANKNLCGNMFFNRVPLTISNWVDHHTGNYIWNGRCRFGVGFGNYKHIALITDEDSNDKAETITLS